jgi:hypothetical protein
MTTSSFSIEQRLLVLATAIQDTDFEEDADKIASILVEAAKTIIGLRGEAQKFANVVALRLAA